MRFVRQPFLWIVMVTLSVSAAGQVKQLTREQYDDAIGEAYHAGANFYPLHESISQRVYKNGRLESGTKESDEWTDFNIERRVIEESNRGRLEKLEVIWIDDKFYCRRNDGKWLIESQNCYITKHWGLTTEISHTYTSEETELNGQKVTFLHSYITGRDTTTGPRAFFEEKVWIGKDGLFVRQETGRGFVKPRSVVWIRTDDFNYRAKSVKIEKPIP
jgi:hypothetical protein